MIESNLVNEKDNCMDVKVILHPYFMNVNKQVKNVLCFNKDMLTNYFSHKDIKDRLELSPPHLIKAFNDKIGQFFTKFSETIEKESIDFKANVIKEYETLSTEVDTWILKRIKGQPTPDLTLKTFKQDVQAIVKKAEDEREVTFNTKKQLFLDAVKKVSPLQDFALIDFEDDKEPLSREYREFKFISVKTACSLKCASPLHDETGMEDEYV